MALKVPNRFVIDQEIESDSVVTFNSSADDGEVKSTQKRPSSIKIPVLPKPLAILCLVANIIVPGSGTLVSGLMVFCFNDKNDELYQQVKACLSNVLVGLSQMATAILLIGWVWSIIWGCAIVGHSNYFTKDNPSIREVLPTPSITLAHAHDESNHDV